MINTNYIQEVYIKNKELDTEFEIKYLNTVDKYEEKNSISLTVEISELANETKCFKYWSIKTMDIEKTKLELADCIMMTLYRYNEFKIEVIPTNLEEPNTDILDTFNKLFQLTSNLYSTKDIELTNQILSNLIHIQKLLKITDEECKKSCFDKINTVRERLYSNY